MLILQFVLSRMSSEQKDIRRRCMQSDVRDRTPLERAVVASEEVECKISDITSACKVSRSAFYRAKSAAKDGRKIGKPGRPGLLNPEEEEIVVEMIAADYSARTPVHSPNVCEKVNIDLYAPISLKDCNLIVF